MGFYWPKFTRRIQVSIIYLRPLYTSTSTNDYTKFVPGPFGKILPKPKIRSFFVCNLSRMPSTERSSRHHLAPVQAFHTTESRV